MVRCYRGVAAGNLQYQQALQGIAIPIGGTATPEDHNAGDTRSRYTSWTTRPSVAREKALDSALGGHGVILQKDFAEQDLVTSPDVFDEAEVLIIGIVSGATVTEVL